VDFNHTVVPIYVCTRPDVALRDKFANAGEHPFNGLRLMDEVIVVATNN
jgi:hypothetical protein